MFATRKRKKLNEQAIQVINKAEEILYRDGWVQGKPIARDNSVCATMAVTLADIELGYIREIHVDGTSKSAQQRAMEAIRLALPKEVINVRPFSPLIAFNDEFAKNVYDIFAVFEKAKVSLIAANWKDGKL